MASLRMLHCGGGRGTCVTAGAAEGGAAYSSVSHPLLKVIHQLHKKTSCNTSIHTHSIYTRQ